MPWRTQLCTRLSAPAALRLRQLETDEAASLEEIRIRLLRPMELVFGHTRRTTDYIPDAKAMDELTAALCGYARYACERQMAQGYIPLPGGHRAGVCGQTVQDEGGVLRLSSVTSVCIRVAKHIDGASRPVRRHLLCDSGQPRRVLLLGPPGCGKTTVLRDAALYLSDERGLHVAVADERAELFPCASDMERGKRVDVLCSAQKAQSMQMLIRSMAPEIIVTDEIGKAEDVDAIMEAVRCGVGLLASAHGDALEDVCGRPMLRKLMENRAFDRYILLGRRGTCRRVWNERGEDCGDGGCATW